MNLVGGFTFLSFFNFFFLFYLFDVVVVVVRVVLPRLFIQHMFLFNHIKKLIFYNDISKIKIKYIIFIYSRIF